MATRTEPYLAGFAGGDDDREYDGGDDREGDDEREADPQAECGIADLDALGYLPNGYEPDPREGGVMLTRRAMLATTPALALRRRHARRCCLFHAARICDRRRLGAAGAARRLPGSAGCRPTRPRPSLNGLPTNGGIFGRWHRKNCSGAPGPKTRARFPDDIKAETDMAGRPIMRERSELDRRAMFSRKFIRKGAGNPTSRSIRANTLPSGFIRGVRQAGGQD